ncbi:MAG: Ig-like domain-containing protein, partial [Nocardioidaceae bacterium]
MNFDAPAPAGSSFSFVDGVFQGIDFGTGQWRWEGACGVDPTNHIFFASSSGTSRTFRFSPGPRVLTSVRVFTSAAGTLTLSNDLGQTLTRTVTTGSMQLVTTGWTQAASVITVGFSGGWNLGVDDVVYSVAGGGADTVAPTVSVTGPADGAVVGGTVTVSAQAADNVGVAGVQFRMNGAALGVEDTVAPYATSWDTTTVANDAYTLTAVARDAATNQTTSAPVRVTVSNGPGGGAGAGYALRFRGNGVNDIDRVK